MGQAIAGRPGSGNVALLNNSPGILYQHAYGRIPHQQALLEKVEKKGTHHFVELARRSMDALGLDYQVVFPTPMLTLGMHPQDEIEVAIGAAYNKWLVETILPQDHRLKGMIYLPFNTPEACVEEVEKYAGVDSIIGYSVVSTRNKPVHHNNYMKLYAMMEETGKPFSFHSGFNWNDPSFLQLNRFISMHALSFVHYSLIHMTNWIINGLPERFPKLKVLWVESGLAWIPFLMQRLDHEYQMRTLRRRRCSRNCRATTCRRHVLYEPAAGEDRTSSSCRRRCDTSPNAETQLAVRVRTGRTGTSTRRARSPRCRSSTSRPSATSSGSNAARRRSIFAVKRMRPESQGCAGGAAGRVMMALPAPSEVHARPRRRLRRNSRSARWRAASRAPGCRYADLEGAC